MNNCNRILTSPPLCSQPRPASQKIFVQLLTKGARNLASRQYAREGWAEALTAHTDASDLHVSGSGTQPRKKKKKKKIKNIKKRKRNLDPPVGVVAEIITESFMAIAFFVRIDWLTTEYITCALLAERNKQRSDEELLYAGEQNM